MDEATEAAHWDVLIERLQAHRESVGSPSYGEIADRIKQDRMDRGAPEFAAHIARSSVYDAFRLGRSRINVPLVREIAQALGAKPEQVDVWISACDKPVRESSDEVIARPTLSQSLWLMLACLGINMLGREFVDYFQLPVYLDMVGTAIAAIALGPWRGAAVGASTNIVGIIGSGWISLPFALVNVVGALVWGYGVRRFGMGRSLPRFFLLNVITAVSCTLVAVPIIAIFLGGKLRTGHDMVTDVIQNSVDTFAIALGFSNMLTSGADKLLSGFIALVVLTLLPAAFRSAFPLAMHLAAMPNGHEVKVSAQ